MQAPRRTVRSLYEILKARPFQWFGQDLLPVYFACFAIFRKALTLFTDYSDYSHVFCILKSQRYLSYGWDGSILANHVMQTGSKAPRVVLLSDSHQKNSRPKIWNHINEANPKIQLLRLWIFKQLIHWRSTTVWLPIIIVMAEAETTNHHRCWNKPKRKQRQI